MNSFVCLGVDFPNAALPRCRTAAHESTPLSLHLIFIEFLLTRQSQRKNFLYFALASFVILTFKIFLK